MGIESQGNLDPPPDDDQSGLQLSAPLRVSALSGSPKLATSPVPGEVESPVACAAPNRHRCTWLAQQSAGRTMPALRPSPGTGEGPPRSGRERAPRTGCHTAAGPPVL